MKFYDLEIENFLAITSAKFNLADRGLVLIEGVNNSDTSAKSNGAGKSSIADALCWVWFGTTARKETGDDIVNDITGKNCSVKSVVVDGGLTYTAVRYRKHKIGKDSLTISVNDGFKTTELTKGTNALTQEVANQIIGSSLDVFSGSIYAGQERMPDLPAMTDKALKVLIEEAAGVTALEQAYKEAREKARIADIALSGAKSAHNMLIMKLKSNADMIANTEESEKIWAENNKTDSARLLNEVRTVDKPLYETMQAEHAAMQALKLEDQIAAIDAKINAVTSEHVMLRSLVEKENAAKYAIDIAENNYTAAVRALKKLDTDLAAIEHQVGCPCDSCGRPLTENEIVSAKDAIKAKIVNAKADISKGVIDTNEARELHKSATEARQTFEASMTDISAENASKGALARSLNEMIVKGSQIDAMVVQMRSKMSRIKELQAAVSPYTSQLEDLRKKNADVCKEITEFANRVSKANAEVELMSEVVKVFAPGGVRARILDEVTPYLNTQTSKYLSILSDGNIEAIWTTLTKNAKGEFKEKFSIDVRNLKGGKKFGLISGGEKRKVRIATALGLQDLVATRATKPIDIFIGDEIDDALDAAGLERLMVILEEKARERGSVLIISHNELRDHIRNVITIEKTAKGETIVTESVS